MLALALPPALRSSTWMGVSARCPPPHCVAWNDAAGAYSSDDWMGDSWTKKEEQDDEERQRNYDQRWLSLCDCDVLTPPLGEPCAGIVHFVGGALVGATPKPSYSAFLEDLSDAANLCIVATPVAGLTTGLDHNAAASEVMLRWCAALPTVHEALEVRERALSGSSSSSTAFSAADLPVIGVGHSLGAKLLVLLGSDSGMAENLGPRCANALVAYNSYSARQSIPMLEQASAAASAAQASGIGGAVAPGLSSLSNVGENLSASASEGLRALGRTVGDGKLGGSIDAGLGALADGLGGLGLGLGSPGVGAGKGSAASSEQLASGLEGAAQALGSLGAQFGQVGRRASDRLSGEADLADDEFTPSPEETARIVSSRNAVGRNLLLRFSDDSIDQSPGLARLLKARFTDDVTGIGGRLDFKTLDGSHVTPNTPRVRSYLGTLDVGLAEQLGVADAARSLTRAEEEREATSEALGEFARREIARARQL